MVLLPCNDSKTILNLHQKKLVNSCTQVKSQYQPLTPQSSSLCQVQNYGAQDCVSCFEILVLLPSEVNFCKQG